MAARRSVRASVRIWQTDLFILVVVVAILILSLSLTQGLRSTLDQLGRSTVLHNASALASQLSPEFPLTVESLRRVKAQVKAFREIYADNIWVYDLDGTLMDSAASGGPPASQLEQARIQGLADHPPYTSIDLKSGGFAVAGKAIYDAAGRRAGTVVLAEPVSTALAVLDAVRSRLWVTFWIALIVAGLLGFAFSEFIGRRVREMSRAAAAVAAGDFSARVPIGLVPDEVRDLAESYNQMAVKLGEAFSSLEQREQELTAVVQSMAEGVVAFDAEGVVRIANPEARRLLGGPDTAPIGSAATDVVADPALLRVVRSALAGSGEVATASLGETTVLAIGTPLRSHTGEAEGAVLLLRDITEEKRLEETQRRFVANASHEMRTPIAAIKGLLELLEDGAASDATVRDDFLRTMSLEADRLGRLVADLLTLAQLEGGSFHLNRAPQSMEGMLSDVGNVMRALAERAGVALNVELPDGNAELDADRDRVVQVLVGFVDNALKHSKRGDTVTLRGSIDDRTGVLEVSDQGPGIPPEDAEKIFDRFYRANESRSGPGGAGLGLSIAREIVEAHGSRIEVGPGEDGGATFRFRLPLSD